MTLALAAVDGSTRNVVLTNEWTHRGKAAICDLWLEIGEEEGKKSKDTRSEGIRIVMNGEREAGKSNRGLRKSHVQYVRLILGTSVTNPWRITYEG